MGKRSIADTNKIRLAAGLTPLATAEERKPIIVKEVRIKEVKVKQPPKIIERVVKEIVREVIIKRPVGRPRKPPPILANSDKAKHQLFLSELLNGNAEKLIKKVIVKALDDEDKDQMMCMKMCIERVLPVSYFEKAKESGSKGVSITIMGIGGQETKLISSTADDDDDDIDIDDTSDDDDIDIDDLPLIEYNSTAEQNGANDNAK